jgi:hypothetical protein
MPYFHLAFARYTTGPEVILNRTSDSVGKNKNDTSHTNHDTAHPYSIPHVTAVNQSMPDGGADAADQSDEEPVVSNTHRGWW